MPANLTDTDAFTSPVQVPAGSDPRALTYLLTAFQALANRTHYLNKLANDVTERTFVVSPHQAQFTTGWTRGNTSLTSTSNSAVGRLPLDFTTPGSGTDIVVELGLVTSGTALQVLTTTALSETINRVSGKNYVAILTANSGAAGANDTLWGFQIVADLVGIGAF